ncbi:hypothetical protein AAFN46_09815 [Pseudomonas sp. CAU 1711]|uniref:hypothetical protein n=1 Tax=Pseudomonas sp. CAU 1711 TaxID=3140356 RepID=UPI0032612173
MSIALALLVAGLLAALLYRQKARQRERRHNHAQLQALMHSLEMLQRLQKHRGLGGQDSAAARNQCRQLADELERLWRNLPPAAQELEELQRDWPGPRSRPDDFDAHCRLIERLLTAMQLFELRQGEELDIARQCRELEELARLRGLAVRGARASRCPLPLQVQLRYLSLRLQRGAAPHGALASALERLQRQLIEPLQVGISAQECFELLTPLIDEQLGALRQRLLVADRNHQEPRT